MYNICNILIAGMGLGINDMIRIENKCTIYVKHLNCRDGPGKLQNLSENPPLEASACQEDQLKVVLLRMMVMMMKLVMIKLVMMMMMMKMKLVRIMMIMFLMVPNYLA